MRVVSRAILAIWIGSLLPLGEGAIAKEKNQCPTPLIRKISPQIARPGDQVRIRGWGFGTKEGEVIFQYKEGHKDKNEDVYKQLEWMVDTIFSPKKKAKIVKWTHIMIIVVVPESATTGPLTVSLPCGSLSNEYPFVVIEARDADTKSTPPPPDLSK